MLLRLESLNWSSQMNELDEKLDASKSHGMQLGQANVLLCQIVVTDTHYQSMKGEEVVKMVKKVADAYTNKRMKRVTV